MTQEARNRRIVEGHRAARERLLSLCDPSGHWTGELSSSPLSTATAVVALEMVARSTSDGGRADLLRSLARRGIDHLATSSNPDGGWGDTSKSISNISTTMLAHAAFFAAGREEEFGGTVARAQVYIDRAGGIPAVRARYGKDHTFSVPILTHLAICGRADWKEIPPLPFELACVPANWFKFLSLPVVSYALPALIAIGQAVFHHRPGSNPLARLIRRRAIEPSLKVLESIQPASGGFLEATPLTSFVTMSLASIGRANSATAKKGIDFLIRSVRPDGSWPIDTNLATWVTTLSVNALEGEIETDQALAIRDWILDQQYTGRHPYTNAAPGGWAWTDLSGGVPDADDTPGALLALRTLPHCQRSSMAASRGVKWLLELQNRDGGWPTFCRGWGYLPFDRSSTDLTAHAMRAVAAWSDDPLVAPQRRRIVRASARGRRFLEKTQRPSGSWIPLWFGNQHAPDDENPVYGTARVLAAFRDLGWSDSPACRRGLRFLADVQNEDGGFGGAPGTPSTVEETALATGALIGATDFADSAGRGIDWLLARVGDGRFEEPAPIGFYFARLWYFEQLYPIIFTVEALARARSAVAGSLATGEAVTVCAAL